MSDVGEKVRFDDACVFVRELGEGPPLLLINGLGAHTAMWDTLERTLDGFRILEFDLPGAGRSDVPRRPVSVRRLARVAAAVMDRFGVERADVVGYSMGGIVAQQLAADAPDRVRRLALVATSPGLGAVHGDVRALLNIATPARYMSPRLYAKTIGSLAGGRARHDTAWVAEQGALRLRHAPPLLGYLGQIASLTFWSGLPFLAQIQHPALVVAGDDDPLTPVANGMLLAHMLPNGRLRVVSGEGHLMLMDADSAALPAIREFLSAPRLDQARVWREASQVDAQELGIGIANAGWQIPSWSAVAALMRRNWVGRGAPVSDDSG
jgi:pimeloyl-ACP methyl ester carboxylesterase